MRIRYLFMTKFFFSGTYVCMYIAKGELATYIVLKPNHRLKANILLLRRVPEHLTVRAWVDPK